MAGRLVIIFSSNVMCFRSATQGCLASYFIHKAACLLVVGKRYDGAVLHVQFKQLVLVVERAGYCRNQFND